MESAGVVVDTNIFIDHLRAKDKTQTALYKISGKQHLQISTITLYELQMGATTDEKRSDVKLLTEDLAVLPLTGEIAMTAATIYHQLRRLNKLIEFRDIFIAATCIVHELPLKTKNKKHFSRIQGLKFE